MTQLRVCSRSGSLYQGKCVCPHCQNHEQRRNTKKLAKRRLHGRNTAQWGRTRTRVLARAGNQCELRLRGCTGKATSVHKTSGGYHDTNPDNYKAACAHCHGVIDAPRATRR